MPYNPPYVKMTTSSKGDYLGELSSLFRTDMIRSLRTESKFDRDFFARILCDNFSISVSSYSDLFENAYRILFWYYRSEYVFKNALFNKRVLNRNTTIVSSFITELRVEEHALDVLLPQSTELSIEIKSPLDGMNRINGQLESFKKVFPKLYVLTDYSKLHLVTAITPPEVGIIIFTNRYQFTLFRHATIDFKRLEKSVMFDTLRASEYVNVLPKTDISQHPNTKRYNIAKSDFCNYDNKVAYDFFLAALIGRSPTIETATLKSFPHSIRLAVYNSRIPVPDISRIKEQFFKR
ncbi:MAG: sce7726 family protein [Candidatus Electryonea clarkiae]|nr:sce7726 family protein [Candidatus Electryonea clarkiae]MDP8288827.1 sce7726 family protein [Candidatus Electryonea clarkiae]